MTPAEDRLRKLMERSLAGESAAHHQLLTELAVYLRRFYARGLGSDAPDLEDLVQETLIAVHTRRESYDPQRSFMTWAFSMTRYKMIDHLRRRSLRLMEPIAEAEDLFAEDLAGPAMARADLERLMGVLTPNQRTTIKYVKIDGMTVVEAAARSGLSPANVKVNVHRGLNRLRALAFGRKPDADR